MDQGQGADVVEEAERGGRCGHCRSSASRVGATRSATLADRSRGDDQSGRRPPETSAAPKARRGCPVPRHKTAGDAAAPVEYARSSVTPPVGRPVSSPRPGSPRRGRRGVRLGLASTVSGAAHDRPRTALARRQHGVIKRVGAAARSLRRALTLSAPLRRSGTRTAGSCRAASRSRPARSPRRAGRRRADGLRVLHVSDIHTGAFLRPAVSQALLRARDAAPSGPRRDHRRHRRRTARRPRRLPAGARRAHARAARRVVLLRQPRLLHGASREIRLEPCVGRDHDAAERVDGRAWRRPEFVLGGRRRPDARHAGLGRAPRAARRRRISCSRTNPTTSTRPNAAAWRSCSPATRTAARSAFPTVGPIMRQSRFYLDEGLYAHAMRLLVVTRGLGAVGLPWRAGAAPEAVLLTVRSQPS